MMKLVVIFREFTSHMIREHSYFYIKNSILKKHLFRGSLNFKLFLFSMDSDLEAFSLNPTDDSFASLSVRTNAYTKYPTSQTQSYLLTVKSRQAYTLNGSAFWGTLSTQALTCRLLHGQVIHFYHFLLNDFKSFNPLFKVLFIFPSQYLFAIGFPSIFSLRRSLSPI